MCTVCGCRDAKASTEHTHDHSVIIPMVTIVRIIMGTATTITIIMITRPAMADWSIAAPTRQASRSPA